MFVLSIRLKKLHLKVARVVTIFLPVYKSLRIFQDAQEHLTSQSMVGSGPMSKPSDILWLCELPARMKKIQSNIKAPECSQHFPKYNPM